MSTHVPRIQDLTPHIFRRNIQRVSQRNLNTRKRVKLPKIRESFGAVSVPEYIQNFVTSAKCALSSLPCRALPPPCRRHAAPPPLVEARFSSRITYGFQKSRTRLMSRLWHSECIRSVVVLVLVQKKNGWRAKKAKSKELGAKVKKAAFLPK